MDDVSTLRAQQPANGRRQSGSNGDNADGAPQKSGFPGIILSKLTSPRQSKEISEGERAVENNAATEEASISGGSLASVSHQQRRMRRRKGSLRKTALLGNGVLRLESRAARAHASRATAVPSNGDDGDAGAGALDHSGMGAQHDASSSEAAQQQPLYDQFTNASPRPPTPPDRPLPSLSQPQTQSMASQQLEPSTIVEDLPKSPETDGEVDNNPELVSLRSLISMPYPAPGRQTRSAGGGLSSPPNPPPRMHTTQSPSCSSDSYAPSQMYGGSMTTSRLRESSQRITSPLATNSAEVAIDPNGWDYAETEWWGWIILIVTWLVFVVGMGSCLGVWSWAWDVGETPYAPPELEDDPTLPIVGYYPALMTLTAVMAWVWVIIAWVGMKYFRHAKISGEDI